MNHINQHFITTPVSENVINNLVLGEILTISGNIYTGRDAVLPKVVNLIKSEKLVQAGINLQGSIVFHTAVSSAGVGPTSSNKLEIENNIPDLAKAGVKIHIGKGALKESTVKLLHKYNSVYAVTPPVSALLSGRIKDKLLIAFPEEGMEAFYQLSVENFPVIVTANHGSTIHG